jgi:hypothetical protein
VLLDDLLADRESNPRAGILTMRVQPLKDLKQLAHLLWINANAIVLDGKPPVTIFLDGRDMNPGRRCTTKLERVADQILQHLGKTHGITLHRR